jgi:hypothetical protein
MNEYAQDLKRIATALELLAECARKMVDPTTEELQERIQRSMDTARFLDKVVPSPGEAFN